MNCTLLNEIPYGKGGEELTLPADLERCISCHQRGYRSARLFAPEIV